MVIARWPPETSPSPANVDLCQLIPAVGYDTPKYLLLFKGTYTYLYFLFHDAKASILAY